MTQIPLRAPLLAAFGLLSLSACAELGMEGTEPTPAAAAAAAVPDAPVVTLDPTPPPPPPVGANTVETLDTTTEEDRQAALAPPEPEGEERLGTTLATLGSPADPGIWIETPLVSAVTPGRVEVEGGESINIELRPSGGAPGSGSEISLPAMRLLNVPLTAIQELVVYRLPSAA